MGESMIGRLLVMATLLFVLPGCIMVPLALVGPAASGFSTASIVQSAATQTASYIIKKKTGKTFAEHAFSAIDNNKQAFNSITEAVLQNSYLPEENNTPLVLLPAKKPTE